MNAGRWPRIATALAVAGLLTACSAHTRPPTVTATAAEPAAVVHDLRSLADLETLFNRDRDHPRTVLLLSPT